MVLCDPLGYSESASCSSEASHGSGRRNQELRGRPASSGENNASAVTHKGASHFPGTRTIRWQASWRCLTGPLSPGENRSSAATDMQMRPQCQSPESPLLGLPFRPLRNSGLTHQPNKSSGRGLGNAHGH